MDAPAVPVVVVDHLRINPSPRRPWYARWLDIEVALWVPRVLIALFSAALAAFGFAGVQIAEGKLAWSGSFVPEFSLAILIGLAAGLVAVFVPKFAEWKWPPLAVGIGLVAWAVVVGADSWLSGVVIVAASVLLFACLPLLGRALGRATKALGRVLRRRLFGVLLLLLVGSLLAVPVLVDAPAAFAQTATPTCTEADVRVSLDGTALRLGSSNDPDRLDGIIELRSDAERFEFAAELVGDTVGTRTVTIELIETEPFDIIRGAPEPLWHTQVRSGEIVRDTLIVERDGALNTYRARVGETAATIPMFTGVGHFRVTITDPDTRSSCDAELQIRFAASGLSTIPGLVATAVALVAAAGLASVATTPLPFHVNRRSMSIDVHEPDGTIVNRAAGATVEVPADGVPRTLNVSFDFLKVEEDQERIEQLKKAGGRVSVVDSFGIVRAPITLDLHVGGGVAGIPLVGFEANTDATVSLKLGGVKTTVHVRAHRASASAGVVGT